LSSWQTNRRISTAEPLTFISYVTYLSTVGIRRCCQTFITGIGTAVRSALILQILVLILNYYCTILLLLALSKNVNNATTVRGSNLIFMKYWKRQHLSQILFCLFTEDQSLKTCIVLEKTMLWKFTWKVVLNENVTLENTWCELKLQIVCVSDLFL
jgi:hypothetical protein